MEITIIKISDKRFTFDITEKVYILYFVEKFANIANFV